MTTLVLTSDPSDVIAIQATPVSTWLKHPSRPELNMLTVCKTDDTRTISTTQGVFSPLGTTTQIVVTDTARKLPAGSVSFYTPDGATLQKLMALLSTGDTLLLQEKPPTTESGENLYIQVGTDIKIDRAGTLLVQTDRFVSITYIAQEVP